MQVMKYTQFIVIAALFALPSIASAATPSKFEVTGWIPYWRTATGTADVLPHLDSLTEVDPFVFTLKNDGTLADNGPLNQDPWLSFNAAAKAKGVRVVPTIMWGNKDAIHAILGNQKQRIALETRIVKMVKDGGFDGVDIDFENKSASDKGNFSTFLKGLYQRIGSKMVMCTIEPRTPVEDRYFGTDVPPDASTYANDLKEINKYCDRVRIMAYDQQGIDLKLSTEAGSRLYAPVADPAWIEKVIALMSKDIKKSKILLGVPTYGYEYSVTAYEGGQNLYDILWTFNPRYATDLARTYNVTPERAYWGEMAFSYVPLDTATTTPPDQMPANVVSSPNTALSAAAAAAAFADQYKSHLTYRYVVWPDAQSIQDKAVLAKNLGLRGISIFKFDGGEDPAMWNALVGLKK